MLRDLMSLWRPRTTERRPPRRVLIVGAGKSGTTALHFRIKNAMQDDTVGVFEPQSLAAIKDEAGETSTVVAKMLLPAAEPELDPLREWFDHRVLIVRDPRDVIVSGSLYTTAYHFCWDSRPDQFAEYVAALRRKEADPASISLLSLLRLMWRGFDTEAFARRIRHLDITLRTLVEDERAFTVVTYEDMLQGRLHHLEHYLGLDLSAEAGVDPAMSRVVRTKGTGSWRHWFTPEDVDYFKPLFEPIMDYFDYDTGDWALAEQPAIKAEYASAYFTRVVNDRRQTEGLPPFA